MLTWYPNLYIDKMMKVGNLSRRVKRSLNHGRTPVPCFLITLAVNESNELEIIHTANLKQKSVYARTPMIVGMALTHEKAVDLVVEITEQVLEETGDVKIRKYLEERS